jgi:single-strand DNA-binding protein
LWELCDVEFREPLLKGNRIIIQLFKFSQMNSLRNKVNLIGRLGAQPEISSLESGRILARFTLATNERYKDKNEVWQDNTQWHTINAWGKVAEKAQKSLDKGVEVLVEGKLVQQSYETKEGEKRYSTVVEVSDFLLVGPKSSKE